jgi:DnaK suppressor protein
MRYLTTEQRKGLEARLKFREAMLSLAISDALRISGDERAIALANHLDEIHDEAIADLASRIEIAGIEPDLRELREVEHALGRIHEPDYGSCGDCSEGIPFMQLVADPTALRCIGCQERAERPIAAAA